MKKIILLAIICLVSFCSCGDSEIEYMDGFEVASFDKFNSYASENGLKGTPVFVDGIISDVGESENDICYIVLKHADGEEWLVGTSDYWLDDFEKMQDEYVYIYGFYNGYSDRVEMPCIVLVDDKDKKLTSKITSESGNVLWKYDATPLVERVASDNSRNAFDDETIERIRSILVEELGYDEVVSVEATVGKVKYVCKFVTTDGGIYNNTLYVDAGGKDNIYSIDPFTSEVIVFYEDGNIIFTPQEYTNRIVEERTEKEEKDFYENRDSYYIIAETIVKESVNTRNRLKFPPLLTSSSDIGFGYKGNYVVVQSYVDIQNGIGNWVRYDYTVEFIAGNLDYFEYTLVYLDFNGEKYGEYVPVN